MFQFDADNETLDQGTWVPYMGSEFLVAHISSMKFQRALNRLQLPHRKKIADGTLDPEIQRDVTCRAMAEAILLDWRKVADSKGQVVEFSKERALTALRKDPEFRDFISETAMSMAHFRKEEAEQLGND